DRRGAVQALVEHLQPQRLHLVLRGAHLPRRSTHPRRGGRFGRPLPGLARRVSPRRPHLPAHPGGVGAAGVSEPEAATTWALAVGIAQYDNPNAVPPLRGAVTDAIAAVGWLRGLGVPDDHILLRAAPSAESRPALDGLGLAWDGATEPKIWTAAARLSQVSAAEGTRLFVFLSGHGLYEPDSGRIFLTQEAGATPLAYENLGIDEYVKLFRWMSFRRQFL